ncbi:MAG: DUF4115 domain-containing protein [Candidatus Omnitrophica bacterium]|nr:DUF4115 domain-containing protein [Candidatus Omnitrophota bacterium]
MDTIGIVLRQKREELGLSLSDAAKKTKIHINILKALEEDRFEGISPVYVKGFLKIYSRLLGLNEREVIDKYSSLQVEQETFDFEKQKEPKKEDTALSKIDYRLAAKAAAGVVVLLLLFFMVSKAARFIGSHRARKPVRVRTASPRAGLIPINKTNILKLSVLVKEDSWVKVKADGRTVFQNVLKRGKTEVWQAKDKIELSLGNAGATELEVNGKIISGLGRRGQVIKSILITKEGLEIKG